MKKILIALILLGLVAGAGYGYHYLVEQNKKSESKEPEVSPKMEESTETGSWNVTGFQLGKYMIKITSEEMGHPSGDANFEVTFSYKDDLGYTNNILVDFFGVNKKIEEDFEDFEELEGIAINGLDYRIKNEKEDSKTLLHKIDDENYLKITLKIFAKVKYDENGNEIKDEVTIENIISDNQEELPGKEPETKTEEQLVIDENILQRDEIQKIINIEIEEIKETEKAADTEKSKDTEKEDKENE